MKKKDELGQRQVATDSNVPDAMPQSSAASTASTSTFNMLSCRRTRKDVEEANENDATPGQPLEACLSCAREIHKCPARRAI